MRPARLLAVLLALATADDIVQKPPAANAGAESGAAAAVPTKQAIPIPKIPQAAAMPAAEPAAVPAASTATPTPAAAAATPSATVPAAAARAAEATNTAVEAAAEELHVPKQPMPNAAAGAPKVPDAATKGPAVAAAADPAAGSSKPAPTAGAKPLPDAGKPLPATGGKPLPAAGAFKLDGQHPQPGQPMPGGGKGAQGAKPLPTGGTLKGAQLPGLDGALKEAAIQRGKDAGAAAGQKAAQAKMQAQLAKDAERRAMGKEMSEAKAKAMMDEMSAKAHAIESAEADAEAEAEAEADAANRPAKPSDGKLDDNPLCKSWAQSGECIRNPQYMWAVCSASCSGLSYIDADPSCAGWAEAGECEKNPEFMLLTCNASCVRSVRRGGAERGGAHVNPNLLSGADRGAGADRAGGERTHRARTFLPIFLAIAALLAVVAGVQLTYAKELSARQEAAGDAWARKIVVLQRQLPWLAPLLGGLHIDAAGRGMICLYFLNEGLTVVQTNPQLASILSATHLFNGDGVWQEHVAWVDTANLVGAAAALLALCNYRLLPCACLMLADTVVDSYILLGRIAWQWLFGRGLYINELMAKKFSLLGCVAMLIAVTAQARSRKSSFGLLLDAETLSTRTSLALLLSRLLIAVLFLFVGLSELHRLLFQPFTPYLPGDGHDVVWPKAVELLLAIPFTLGFKTTLVSRLLAVSLVLEALYAWSWWTIPGDSFSFAHHRRAIHYREHFVTNVATAGGLLLLQKIGGGKYTVDALLKKQD